MSLPANPRRDRYVANQGQTVFPYTFRIFAASDLVVERLRNNTTTTLQLNVDYTVSGIGNNTGGNVTLTQGAEQDDIIAIVSNQPNQRSTDFTESGDFRAAALNAEFDRIWIGIQQLAQDVSRQITRPLSDPTASYVLPPAAVRANKYLAFAADGSLTFPVAQPAGPNAAEAYWWGGTAGGTANALTIFVSGPPTAYAEGQRFAFVVASNNTGAATLAVNGLAAKSIRRPNGSTLAAGDLAAGTLVAVTYDGTNFRLVSDGGPWTKVVDAAIANSSLIDVSGFSLADYHLLEINLLNVFVTAASPNNVGLQIYRNGSLITTQYSMNNRVTSGTSITVSRFNNNAFLPVTDGGVSTTNLTAKITIAQQSNGDLVYLDATCFYISHANFYEVFCSSGFVFAGSGWLNGFRIQTPTNLQANIGRLVVMGVKRT
jgi:hypothetical protein